MNNIKIKTEKIQLDQFLKWANIVNSGGEAKMLIQAGKVKVNGEINTKRAFKLTEGDQINLEGQNEVFRVVKK